MYFCVHHKATVPKEQPETPETPAIGPPPGFEAAAFWGMYFERPVLLWRHGAQAENKRDDDAARRLFRRFDDRFRPYFAARWAHAGRPEERRHLLSRDLHRTRRPSPPSRGGRRPGSIRHLEKSSKQALPACKSCQRGGAQLIHLKSATPASDRRDQGARRIRTRNAGSQ